MSRQKKVAIVDLQSDGHHSDYIERYVASFTKAGADVVCYYPLSSLLNLPEKVHRYDLNIPTKANENSFLYALRTILSYWTAVKQAIIESRENIDVVYFMSLDQFIYHSPKSIMNKLFALLVQQIFPWKWSGLIFGIYYIAPNGVIPNTSILRSYNCIGMCILDPYIANKLEKEYDKPIGVLPDVTNPAAPDKKWDVLQSIQEQSNGRPIIALVGALQKRKGLIPFLELSHKLGSERYMFVCMGKVYWDSFSEEEQSFIKRNMSSLQNGNLFFFPKHIPTESTFNAAVSISTILFAGYIDFPSSSGILSKAALFNTPVIVSSGYLMEKHVKKYHLGSVLPAPYQANDILGSIQEILGTPTAFFSAGCARYNQICNIEALDADIALFYHAAII